MVTDSRPVTAALRHVRSRSAGGVIDGSARVTVHFHPDAPYGQSTVIQSLAQDGVYRSQFETGIGNGGLTAHPGGDRWLWESELFGACYDTADPTLRPKYGSVNLRNDAYGGSPRFGSSYLRLTAAALARATFCCPDSVFRPTHVGTADRFDRVRAVQDREFEDPLDAYVEAHVHGVLDLRADVEALVLDPSFRGSDVERAASELGCPVEWHPGYAATAAALGHPEYRDETAVRLGMQLASDGLLTPHSLGLARRRRDLDPQELKRVWHLLARYGRLA